MSLYALLREEFGLMELTLALPQLEKYNIWEKNFNSNGRFYLIKYKKFSYLKRIN